MLLSAATLMIRLLQKFRGLFSRSGGATVEGGAIERTSTFGLLIQISGAGFLVWGIYMIYPPAAYILGGIGAVLAGERL